MAGTQISLQLTQPEQQYILVLSYTPTPTPALQLPKDSQTLCMTPRLLSHLCHSMYTLPLTCTVGDVLFFLSSTLIVIKKCPKFQEQVNCLYVFKVSTGWTQGTFPQFPPDFQIFPTVHCYISAGLETIENQISRIYKLAWKKTPTSCEKNLMGACFHILFETILSHRICPEWNPFLWDTRYI